MDTENTQEATKVRERGNQLYKKGQFDEAAKAYEEAARLAPSDPSPFSNLSAAKFEAGKYVECVVFTRKALGLLGADPGAAVVRERLLIRQAKAYLHLSSLDKAEKLLDEIESGKDSEDLHNLLRGSRKFDAFSPEPVLLRNMLLQLPRLRPSIQDEPEYFGPGHDKAESMYTAELEKSAGKDPVLSIMFCGIGDARHFFKTILAYSAKSKSQRLHVTMVDHKPAVAARNLIFFSMLHEAVINQESKNALLLSLGYLYCTQIIPPFVWEKLQETIRKLVDSLGQKQQPLSWVYIPVSQMETVVQVLKSWQQGHATAYKTSVLRRIIPEDIDEAGPPMPLERGQLWYWYPECEADHRVFDEFSVMFPPAAILSKFEPELYSLASEYQRKKEGAQKAIEKYLDKHWKVNVTLIDVEWEARKALGDLPNMGNDPFSIATDLIQEPLGPRSSEKKLTYCFIKHVASFFQRVGASILSLQGRLTAEMIVGDMADVLERTRYGLLDRPKQEDQESLTRTAWPEKYHFIHMSNIPDYVGGSLTSFLYGGHILMEGTGTGLTSCVLRNLPRWRSIDQFNAEYLSMYDRAMVQKHFQVKLANESKAFSMFPFPMLGDFVMSDYHRWERCQLSPLPLDRLMPRADLSKWLFSHFLKTCLPFARPPADFDLVISPHNMTVFLRLLVQVAELGYPGHWLSAIITSLSDGEITTTARAPRRYVLDCAAVDKVHPYRTVCVKPWAAEFTTLITMWRELLPFAVVVPDGTLPSSETIAEYSVRIPPCPARDVNVPHFMLVFWNNRKYGEPPKNLRPLLLDDENGDATTSARKIRSDGVKVLSAFKWVTKESTATFWLRSDAIELMAREDWKLCLWRIDSWRRLTPGQSVKNTVSRKRTWKECVSST
ncbi:hypothetical protein AAE478_006055 [Parahypoxylon ruwenzoriense]